MTDENKKELVVAEQQPPLTEVFSNMQAFTDAQRICRALTQSGIVPTSYQGDQNIPNAMVALEMANRIGISPISVMQNLHIIEGRPSWSSNFIISMLNSSGKFTPLRFRYEETDGEDVSRITKKWNKRLNQYDETKETEFIQGLSCVAYATDKNTGEIIEGPEVSVKMAFLEGWLSKNGSKWRTMPKLMLAYRAAAFFGRLYAPELLLGIHSDDEISDIGPTATTTIPTVIEPDGDIPPIVVQKEAEPEEIEVEIITEESKPEEKAPETVEEKVAAIIEPEKKQPPAPEKKSPAAAKAPFMFNFEE